MITTSPVSTEAMKQRFMFSRSFIYAIHIHVTIKDIHVLPLKIPENLCLKKIIAFYTANLFREIFTMLNLQLS